MHAPFTLFPILLTLFAAQPPTSEPADVAAIQDSSFVNSSFEAEEALRKTREQVDRADWPAAAAAMQEIADKFGDHIIRLERGRYIGIKRFVQTEIASWPTLGLNAYRAAFEKNARANVEEAAARRDIRKLLDIAESYFCTSAGAAALDRAGELAIETADFSSARQRYEELLANHPDKNERGPEWRAKLAMAEAWDGNRSPLKELLADSRLSAELDRNIKWAARERPIRDFLAECLADLDKESPATKITEYAASPASFCGGSDRRAAYRSNAAAEAMLWRCRLYDTQESQAGLNSSPTDATEADMVLRSIESGRLLTMSPVFGDGRIFLSNGQSVWAIDPEKPEKPAWRFDLAGPPHQPMGWISEDEPPDQHTLLFAGGRIIVPLHREVSNRDDDASRRVSALICLDAATGKPLWKNELLGLATRFEELSLDGAPIEHNGLLYTVVRKRKGFGFEACLLLCFKPQDGKLLWSTHVGEAATGSYGFTHPTRSLPAAVGDRIFIHTNLGTIAAVNAFTGRVAWLITYPSRYANETEAAWPTRFGQPLRTWQNQPTMTWRNSIVCAPMDLDQLLILSQFDGRISSRVDMERLFNPESILGIKGDMLYAVGAQIVCHNLGTNEMAWQRPLAETGKPFGRGAIASDGLLIPTAAALLRYPLDGGPAAIHRWRIENAGNILPLDDQIVVAGASAVSGLLARDEAFARLTARFRKNPANTDASLAIAELAFAVGDDARGLNAVTSAVQAAAENAAADVATKRNLFVRILRMAESLMVSDTFTTPSRDREPGESARTDSLIQLIDLAGKIAPDVESRAVHRLIVARLQLQNNNPAEAIAAYQHLLANPDSRRLRLPLPRDWLPRFGEEEPNAIDQETSLYLLAEEWIDAIIERHGRAAYAAVEAEAAGKLKAAVESSDAAAAGNVAETYPNSAAAAEALLFSADLLIRDGNDQAAIRSLTQLLSQKSAPHRVKAIRLLAETLTNNGQKSEARKWLARGLRDFPDHRFAEGKQPLGFADLIAALPNEIRIENADTPALNWPLAPAYRTLFTQRVALLSAMENAAFPGPLDLLITYADSKIDARDSLTGRPIWPEAAKCPTLPILLGHDADRIHFAGAHSIFALNRIDGKKTWQFGAEDDDDPLTDPEELETWTDHVTTGSRIISSSDHGDVVCISASTGALQWRREIEGGTASHLAANDRFVFCAKWRGRSNVIHFIDAATGESRGELICEDSRPIQLLRPTTDGALLVVMAKSIMRVEPSSREIVWSLATSRHFLVSTFLHGEGGFIISDDARRIFKRDDLTGRLLWISIPIGKDDRDGLWTASADGRVIAASRNQLFAFDAADGRLLWRNHDSVSMRWQSPIITTDSVVTIAPHERPTTQTASKPAVENPNSSVAYRITRHALADGKQLPVAEGGTLITESLESFGGLYARDKSLIVLDGERLIGYVAE